MNIDGSLSLQPAVAEPVEQTKTDQPNPAAAGDFPSLLFFVLATPRINVGGEPLNAAGVVTETNEPTGAGPSVSLMDVSCPNKAQCDQNDSPDSDTTKLAGDTGEFLSSALLETGTLALQKLAQLPQTDVTDPSIPVQYSNKQIHLTAVAEPNLVAQEIGEQVMPEQAFRASGEADEQELAQPLAEVGIAVKEQPVPAEIQPSSTAEIGQTETPPARHFGFVSDQAWPEKQHVAKDAPGYSNPAQVNTPNIQENVSNLHQSEVSNGLTIGEVPEVPRPSATNTATLSNSDPVEQNPAVFASERIAEDAMEVRPLQYVHASRPSAGAASDLDILLQQPREHAERVALSGREQALPDPAAPGLSMTGSALQLPKELARERGLGAPVQPLVAQVAGEISGQIRLGRKEVIIRLEPPELGSLKIDLEIDGDQLKARILAQEDSAKSLIERHLPELRQSLHAQQLELVDVRVDNASSMLSHNDFSHEQRQTYNGRGDSQNRKPLERSETVTTDTRPSEQGRVSMWA